MARVVREVAQGARSATATACVAVGREIYGLKPQVEAA